MPFYCGLSTFDQYSRFALIGKKKFEQLITFEIDFFYMTQSETKNRK